MTATNDGETWIRCDTLFTPYQRRRDWMLQVAGGRIVRMMPAAEMDGVEHPGTVHLPDAIVSPGFIDIHVHGASGHDLMAGTEGSLRAVSATLARHGTTSFLATTVSASAESLEEAVSGLARHSPAVSDGARAIGIHLEGPYLNAERAGAHDPAFLRPADVKEFVRLVELSGHTIRRITLAPEVDPGLELVREASRRGILISLGHTNATESQARAAADAGATQTTHTFNAMRPFHHREPGILGMSLTDDRIFAEIIADGVHVHPSALHLILRVKGVERSPLITDGSSATGMPAGSYPLGARIITAREGRCRDEEGGLAGSVLTLDRAVKNLIDWLDVPLHEALTAASATPARAMRIGDRKGIISPGADADLVFLGRDLQVLQTMVAGRIVYRGR